MAESVVRDVIARMAGDPEFARSVAGNPAAALAGYDLTDTERQSLAKLGADTSASAQPLGERLSKSALFVPTSGAHAEAARQAVAATEVPQQPVSAAEIGPVHHEFEQAHHLYGQTGQPAAAPHEEGTGFAGVNRALSAGRELPQAHLAFGDQPAQAPHAAPPVHHASAAPPVHHTTAPPTHHTAVPPVHHEAQQVQHTQAPSQPAPAPTAASAAQSPPAPGVVRPPEHAAPLATDAPAAAQPPAAGPAAATAAAATTVAATAAAAAAGQAPAAAPPPIVAERTGPVTFGSSSADTLAAHAATPGHTPAPAAVPHQPPVSFQPWSQNPTGHAAPPTGAPHAASAPAPAHPSASGGGGGGGAPGKILVTPPVPGESDQFPQLTFPEDKNPPPSYSSHGATLGPPPPDSVTYIRNPDTGEYTSLTPDSSSYAGSAAPYPSHFATPLPPDNSPSPPAGADSVPTGGGYGTNTMPAPPPDFNPPVAPPSFGSYPAPDAGQLPQQDQALAALNANPSLANPQPQTDLSGGGDGGGGGGEAA